MTRDNRPPHPRSPVQLSAALRRLYFGIYDLDPTILGSKGMLGEFQPFLAETDGDQLIRRQVKLLDQQATHRRCDSTWLYSAPPRASV